MQSVIENAERRMLQSKQQCETLKSQLRANSTKDSELQRLRVKVQMQEELLTTLKEKAASSEERNVETTIELDEARMVIAELRAKIERVALIETTLRQVDHENKELTKFKAGCEPKITQLTVRRAHIPPPPLPHSYS